jgi:hypothetical protein
VGIVTPRGGCFNSATENLLLTQASKFRLVKTYMQEIIYVDVHGQWINHWVWVFLSIYIFCSCLYDGVGTVIGL